MSGRLLKWEVKLGQFDLVYKARTTIKGQALADFMVEFTPTELSCCAEIDRTWQLYVDGSSTGNRAGAGVVLISPDNQFFCNSYRFGFEATNNDAEYEALIVGLNTAQAMGVDSLILHSDSQLIVNQIRGTYEAKGEKMKSYRTKVREELRRFRHTEIIHIPRSKNSQADALARLTTSEGTSELESISIETVMHSALDSSHLVALQTSLKETWKDEIIQYLQEGTMPQDQVQAMRLRIRSARYTLIGDDLYKREFSLPLLKCLDNEEAEYVILENSLNSCHLNIVNRPEY